jgi:hypothetical protein
VNRFAAYFSYCSISSKNSLFAKQQTLLSFGAAKLQTIFNPATLLRIFFQKTFQPRFSRRINRF